MYQISSYIVSLFLVVLSSLTHAQNVGIGTTNPFEKLDINGDIIVRGQDIYVAHDGNTNSNNAYISYFDTTTNALEGDGIFHFHSNQARASSWQQPAASISARGAYFTGRVGIGVDTPSTITHISSGTAGSAILTIESDTDNNNESDNPRIDFYQDGRQVGLIMGFYNGNHLNGNVFRLAPIHASVTNWDCMTINAQTQHIGIGTAAQDELLELSGGGIQLNGSYGIGFIGETPYS